MNNNPKQATVMVVDDTPANLQLLNEILHTAGYRSLAFPKARLAIAAAKANPPDLFLLDIMMPKCDGFELCKLLKKEKRLKSVPVIFISALQDSKHKVEAFTRGGVDYITKPFEETEVLARVGTHLQIARQRQSLEAGKRELELSYQALRRVEAQRDNLIHMLVHDMQSPLLGIKGFAELCYREAVDNDLERLAKFSARINQASEHLQAMVSNMLDISRMESASLPLEISPWQLDELANEVVTALEPIAEQRILSVERTEHPVTVFCDPKISRRIIQNMLANAIKFTRRDGEISLVFFHNANQAGMRIIDNGPGIAHADQARIFDKYVQLKEGRKHKRQSSGLGLAFCKMAVLAQQGEIGVESDGASGTTFWFSLPKSDPA